MVAQTADRRPIGALGRMSIVAAIHVAVFYFIARGLNIVPSIIFADPMIGHILEPTKPIEPEKVVIDDRDLLEKSVIEIPAPPPLPVPVETSENAIKAEVVPDGGQTQTSGSAETGLVLTGVRLDARRPLSQPPYPSEMIRANAQGSVDVEVFVDANGRVTDARIAKTSGYDAFDKSTLDEAKRRWRLVPATRDGAPIAQWYRLRVVFKLKDG